MLKSILLLAALSTSLLGQAYIRTNVPSQTYFYGVLVEDKDKILVGQIVTKTVTNWHTISLTTTVCDGNCIIRHEIIHNQVAYIQTNSFVKFEFEGKSHEYQLKLGEEFKTEQKREVIKNWFGEFEPFRGSIFESTHRYYNPTNLNIYIGSPIITNFATTATNKMK